MKENRKRRRGTVVSDKMQKTVVVLVETLRRHPFYGKTVKHRCRFKAHDAHDACRRGDVVEIEETRPLSREKRWRVVRIVAQGQGAELGPAEIADAGALEALP